MIISNTHLYRYNGDYVYVSVFLVIQWFINTEYGHTSSVNYTIDMTPLIVVLANAMRWW